MQTRSIALTVALACAACQSSDPQTGGETHWQKTFLAGCVSDAQCAAPLTCIQHLCTRPCTDDDACDVAEGDVCDESGICVVQEREGCTSGDPCDADHEGWLCDETALDACRSEVTVCRDGAWLDGVLDVCRTQMSEAEPDGPDGPETLTVRRADAIQPVDVLFVVDQSTSMFEASVAAGQAIPSFVAGLRARGVGDFRVAVTNNDAQCDPSPAERVAKGLFNRWPERAVPIATAFAPRLACSDNDACAAACDELGCSAATASWTCQHFEPAECNSNPNGSINSSCRLDCASDADCSAVLGDGYTCATPGAGYSGCIRKLPDDCPAEIPAVLAGDDLALARCAMRMRSSGPSCFRYEEPLKALRLALDPTGPNPDQQGALVRGDAILAVVVLTDEEDCSTAAGATIDEASYDRCGLLGATDEGGPLTPATDYIDFLRALKPPGRTFFAAVGGDSTATDPAVVAAERDAYTASKLGPRACNASTTMCATPDGSDIVDWTPRLFAAVDAMAPDSHGENLCTLGDWDDAFERIAGSLADSATRICLPHAPTPGMTVTRVLGAVETPLVEGATGPGTWHLVGGARECRSGQAIVLGDAPADGETVRVVFAP